ncbi:MAG: Integron-associated effector binding protein [Paenibacillus sp.]|nr:Integron-associated effector binding protein [Paenibacillus sp.]
MSVQVVGKELYAVGMKHSCPSHENPIRIPQAIEQFKQRIDEIPNRTGAVLILFEPVQPDRMPSWLVAAEVTGLTELPSDMVGRHLPEQLYATHPHKGSAARYGDTYSILHTWVLEHGEYDHGHMIERQADFDTDVLSDDFAADVYVPFKPSGRDARDSGTVIR